MTNDQLIRFRTFADEDDTAWNGRDQSACQDTASMRELDEDYLAATLRGAERRPPESRTLVAWGTGLALVAGVAIAVTLLPKPGGVMLDSRSSAATLRVHPYLAPQPGGLASSALLRCYVDGAAVGSLTLADCGRRNGVASGRLDVGLTTPPSWAAEVPPPPSSSTPAFQPAPVARVAPPAPANFEALAQPRRYGPPAYQDDDGDRIDATISPEESVKAARTFYEGLADADGDRAASVVVPEKRSQGPLSAGAITRFYSSLQAPLRLTRLYPVDDHTVVARYAFVDRDGEACEGSARVTTTQRDGEVYVQAIRASDGC